MDRVQMWKGLDMLGGCSIIKGCEQAMLSFNELPDLGFNRFSFSLCSCGMEAMKVAKAGAQRLLVGFVIDSEFNFGRAERPWQNSLRLIMGDPDLVRSSCDWALVLPSSYQSSLVRFDNALNSEGWHFWCCVMERDWRAVKVDRVGNIFPLASVFDTLSFVRFVNSENLAKSCRCESDQFHQYLQK